jgi:hypothetical protein
MKHLFTVIALATSTLATYSGTAATQPTLIDFELSGAKKDRLQLALHRERSERHNLSIGLRPVELAGLDKPRFQGRTSSSIHFKLQRDAGRLDCAGTGGERQASGTCRFNGDPAFATFLVTAGMSRPTSEQMLLMTAVDVRRDLVQALKKGGFAMPTLPDLIAMSAVGVTSVYTRDLAAVGYRPVKTADLIPLRALDVSPAYIASLAKVGYPRLSTDELIQFKALGITANFIADLRQRGHGDLAVSRLVQFKVLGLTPEELGRTVSARGARVIDTPPDRR